MPDTPTVAEWIGQQLDGDGEVGIDGTVNSYSFVENLVADLRHEGGITLRLNFDPLKFIWKDRPSIPGDKVVLQPLEYAGENTISKISRIKDKLRKLHCDGMLVSALDDIAWILNLRGTDVHCNPVFVSYLLIEESDTTLFINKDKLTSVVEEYLQDQNIKVLGYDDLTAYLKRDYFAYNILKQSHKPAMLSTMNTTLDGETFFKSTLTRLPPPPLPPHTASENIPPYLRLFRQIPCNCASDSNRTLQMPPPPPEFPPEAKARA